MWLAHVEMLQSGLQSEYVRSGIQSPTYSGFPIANSMRIIGGYLLSHPKQTVIRRYDWLIVPPTPPMYKLQLGTSSISAG